MNILLTSIGRRSYLVRYFQKALAGHGRVVVTNMYDDTPGMYAGDVAIKVPASYEPDYLPILLQICRDHDIGMLFSLHDMDVTYLSHHKDAFREIGVIPVIAEAWFADICFDKYQTIQFLQKLGLPYCAACLSLGNTKTMLQAGELTYPLIVKPRTGFGSIGLSIVDNDQELASAFEHLQRNLGQTLISNSQGFESDSAIMIQQFVQGQEYGVDVINDLEGQTAAVFVEHKAAMRAGETDMAMIVNNPLLEELGKQIGQAVKHPGVLDLDVIVRDGKPYVLEMNPRFGGHYPFAHLAGADIPAALIAWAGGEEPDPSWLKVELGVRGYKDLVPRRIAD